MHEIHSDDPTETETELLRTVVNRVLGRSWSPALELDLLKAIRAHVAREKARDAAEHAEQRAADLVAELTEANRRVEVLRTNLVNVMAFIRDGWTPEGLYRYVREALASTGGEKG